MKCKNPILPGFYPDPSICRVGKDYYMVTSTFSYFPGVPVFHSRNLAQWEQIGNVLTRNSQVKLAGCGHSEGIFAPTLRYHKGRFYLITTNVSGGGNFIVTAERPEGPWSEPYFLGDAAAGIDPSLFFEEDGTCWYIGQRYRSSGIRYPGDCEIWIQQLDLAEMRLTGEAVAVLNGFSKTAVWPEGPHLYKKDGWYYIIHAEEGTAREHSVMAARSRKLLGPYEYARTNPILTHRHLGRRSPVTCVGHADLVDDGNGNWYMVMLGCRPKEDCTLLGRETFLAKVAWEEDWPVVNPGIGKLEAYVELPDGAPAEEQKDAAELSKEAAEHAADREKITLNGSGALPFRFLMLRNPETDAYDLRDGRLTLPMKPETLRDLVTPSYVAVRQQHHCCQVQTQVLLRPSGRKDCAGLACVQSNEYHIRMELSDPTAGEQEDGAAGQKTIRILLCTQGRDQLLAQHCLPSAEEPVSLCIRIRDLSAEFLWKPSGQEIWESLLSEVSLRVLGTETAGGFVGCTIGMYASANGESSSGSAEFTGFEVVDGIPEKED